MSINNILLIGRLTANPELKHTATNIAVSSFTIAVNRGYAKPGEQTVADFIDVVCWRQTAEFVSKYFTKGKPIFVAGSLQTRMWEDKEGKKRKTVEVVASEVSFAETKASENQNNNAQQKQNMDVEISNDDELPF